MSQLATTPGRTVAPRELQQRVRALVDRVGVVQASKQLGLSRMSTASIVAGLTVRPGTLLMAEARAPRA
jgi:hypothetical protein